MDPIRLAFCKNFALKKAIQPETQARRRAQGGIPFCINEQLRCFWQFFGQTTGQRKRCPPRTQEGSPKWQSYRKRKRRFPGTHGADVPRHKRRGAPGKNGGRPITELQVKGKGNIPYIHRPTCKVDP